MSTKRIRSKWQEIEAAKQAHHKRVVLVLDVFIAVCVLGYICLGINIVQMYLPSNNKHVYNCTVADVHPDFTPAMQKTCKKQFEKETQ